jgi:hypothetical protein
MWLRVNIVAGKPPRFYPMGTELDDGLVPEHAKCFRCDQAEALKLQELLTYAKQVGAEKITPAKN